MAKTSPIDGKEPLGKASRLSICRAADLQEDETGIRPAIDREVSMQTDHVPPATRWPCHRRPHCARARRCARPGLYQRPDRCTSGVYYPLGVALSKIYGDKIKNVRPTVQATKASVENLQLLHRQRAKSPSRSATRSPPPGRATRRRASSPAQEAARRHRDLSELCPDRRASKDSGIKTLADLKGKRLSVGAPKIRHRTQRPRDPRRGRHELQGLAKVEYLPSPSPSS